jgi:tripartite-type tricarboxylate transporter receptor subunit TctC
MNFLEYMGRSAVTAVALLGIAGVATPAFSQSAADFYKGKTVHLIVGTSAGGGYDVYARALAPHLAKKLGANVIVENKPGGSHMVAMNFIYFTAPRDGLYMMLATGEGAVLGKLLNEPGVRFDLTNYPILGRINTAPRILLVNPQLPYKNLKDILTSGKTFTMGFAGKTDGAADTASVFCHALKMKCKPVIGYPSSKEFTLAAIRGEVDGTLITEDSAVRFAQHGQLRPIVTTGREKSALAPDVPSVFEAADVSEEGAWWLDFRDDLRKLGRIMVTSPGTPDDRQAYLKDVIRTVATDKAIGDEFEKRGLPLRYAPPEEMTAIIKNLLGGGISPEKTKEIEYVITEEFY